MELNGACSNPRLQVELPRLAPMRARLRGLALLDPKLPQSPPPRIGGVIDTITAVLELVDQSMRARDIHAVAEELLGEPIKWSSVKATLAAQASRPQGRFRRTGHGRYRIA